MWSESSSLAALRTAFTAALVVALGGRTALAEPAPMPVPQSSAAGAFPDVEAPTGPSSKAATPPTTEDERVPVSHGELPSSTAPSARQSASEERREPRSGPAVAKEEAALPPYQLGGRFAIGGGPNALFVLAQIEAGYRVFPELLLGASLEKSLSEKSMSSDNCAMSRQCAPAYFALGPRAELQLIPEGVIGPWLGAEVGVIFLKAEYMSPTALESTFDLGIDVRPSKSWAIGAYIAAKVFLTEPYETPDTPLGVLSLGLRLSGRF